MYEGKSFQLFNLFSTLQKGQKLFYDLQQTIPFPDGSREEGMLECVLLGSDLSESMVSSCSGVPCCVIVGWFNGNQLMVVAGDSRTRGNHRLRQIRAKKDTFQHSFFPRPIREWNQVPSSVVDAGFC
jgi:hypothetical protein